MNKIYKLVWNNVRGCYVVASEFAKAHGKSARRAVVGAFVAAAMIAGMPSVYAYGTVANGSSGAIIKGEGVEATGQYATAMGFESKANRDYALAAGIRAIASGERSIALGSDAKAIGDNSVAIGFRVKADQLYATAFGSTTIASGVAAFASGDHTEASGDYSTAMGEDAKASGNDSVSIGYKTEATGSYSTAMGARTKATAWYATAMGNETEATEYYALATGYHTQAEGEASTAMGQNTKASGKASTALGDGSKAFGRNSLAALGGITEADAWGSLAIGVEAKAWKANTFAIGERAEAQADNSVAIGNRSVANEANTVSVGSGSVQRRIVNVAAGTANTDAVNYGQLKAVDTRVTNNGNIIKTNTQNIGINRTAINGNAKEIQTIWQQLSDKKDVIFTWNPEQMMGYSYTDEDGKLVYQMGLSEYQIGTVLNFHAGQDDAEANRGKSVNVSNTGVIISNDYTDKTVSIVADGIDMGGSKITNMAKGEVSKASQDAVNGSQLFATNEAVAANKNAISTEKTERINADNELRKEIQSANANLTHKINQTNDRVDRVGATAAALAAINYQPMAKGQSQVAVGMGGYKGKKATALGLAYQITDRVSGSVAGSASGEERMFNVGFNYLFGQHSDKDVAQCAAVPGSMSLKEAEMKSEIDSLKADNQIMKADNQAMKARLDKADAEIAELKAMVKALAAK